MFWFGARCGYETLKMGQRRMQSDVYALGMVYWQMWAMRDPNTLPSVAAKPFRNVTRQQVSARPFAKTSRVYIRARTCCVTHVNRLQLLEKLERSDTPPQPASCPFPLYEVMKKCWIQDAMFRPDIKAIIKAVTLG